MMPQNLLSGLSKEEAKSTSEGESKSTSHVLDRATPETIRQAATAAVYPSAGGTPAQSALLKSMLAEEQLKSALLASQLGSSSGALPPLDSITAALLLRRNQLDHSGALAASQALPSTSIDSLNQQSLSGAFSFSSSPLLSLGMPHQLGLLPGQQSQFNPLSAAHMAPQAALGAAVPLVGKKGRAGTFPQKLHRVLSELEKEEGGKEIASFLPHGRAFAIHKPKEFVKDIMPKYFRMSRFSSFQRQLNLYEFQRITEGPDKGAYYHELFVQAQPLLCTSIKRTKIKGTATTSMGNGVAGGVGASAMAAAASAAATTRPVVGQSPLFRAGGDTNQYGTTEAYLRSLAASRAVGRPFFGP